MDDRSAPSPPQSPPESLAPAARRLRKPPRWTLGFLRALERCGEVRRAAEDAGIDFSTAYARRKAHGDFAAAWDLALRRHSQATEATAGDSGAHETPAPSPLRPEELTATPTQVKRAGHGRWSAARERCFLTELTASANVRRAAAAAEISTAALYARRVREPRFAAAWDHAVEAGKVRVQAYLVEAAQRTFDPEDLPFADGGPTVTVSEAIHIARLKGPSEASASGARSRAGRDGRDPFFDCSDEGEQEHIAAIERIQDRLQRLNQQSRAEQEAAGWDHDEDSGAMVPPGWGRAQDFELAGGGGEAGEAASRQCPHCGGGLTLRL